MESLETKLQDILTEISYHRQQLGIVKSESETANQVLNMKIDEMRGRIEFEERKIQNNITNEYNKQQKVHDSLHQQIKALNVESDTCNSKAMALDRRIEEIEKIIGVKACFDEETGKSLI